MKAIFSTLLDRYGPSLMPSTSSNADSGIGVFQSFVSLRKVDLFIHKASQQNASTPPKPCHERDHHLSILNKSRLQSLRILNVDGLDVGV